MNNKKIIAFVFCNSLLSGVIFSFQPPFVDYNELQKEGQRRTLQSYKNFFSSLESFSLKQYCLSRINEYSDFDAALKEPCFKYFATMQISSNTQGADNSQKIKYLIHEINNEMNNQ